MRNAVIVLLILVFVGYVFVQGISNYKAKSDLQERLDYHLDFVDEASIPTVKEDVIHDAKKFGIDLTPENINILYEDTEQRTVAQKLVGNKLPVEFTNKRVSINVHYEARILGIPFKQQVVGSKIKQVQAPRAVPSPEMQPLLNNAQ